MFPTVNIQIEIIMKLSRTFANGKLSEILGKYNASCALDFTCGQLKNSKLESKNLDHGKTQHKEIQNMRKKRRTELCLLAITRGAATEASDPKRSPTKAHNTETDFRVMPTLGCTKKGKMNIKFDGK